MEGAGVALGRRIAGRWGGGAALVLFAVACWLEVGSGAVADPARAGLERQFAERMRDVTMVGTFTVAGREGRSPEPDRYEIASVRKVGENSWQFNARMDCCGQAGKAGIPIVVPMRFVGDTPVIMMTDTSLPGVGTFTVRVFFYGDRYAAPGQPGSVLRPMSGGSRKTVWTGLTGQLPPPPPTPGGPLEHSG